MKQNWLFLKHSVRLVVTRRKALFWFLTGLYAILGVLNGLAGQWWSALSGLTIWLILIAYLAASVRAEILMRAIEEMNDRACHWESAANAPKFDPLAGAVFYGCAFGTRQTTERAIDLILGPELAQILNEEAEKESVKDA